MITYEFDGNTASEHGGTYYPVIVCDGCLRRITGPGNTFWAVRDDGEVMPQVWHTHKQCAGFDRVIATHHRHRVLVMSENLATWLDQVRGNTAPPTRSSSGR